MFAATVPTHADYFAIERRLKAATYNILALALVVCPHVEEGTCGECIGEAMHSVARSIPLALKEGWVS